MPALAFPKSTLGAIVSVVLLPSSRHRLAASGLQRPPTPMNLRMLLDTGAEGTSVDAAQIHPSWNLSPSGRCLSQSMGGVNRLSLYDIEMQILDGQGGSALFWRHDPLRISCCSGTPFSGMPYNGVIGRNVLDRGLLVYNGLNAQCTLAY